MVTLPFSALEQMANEVAAKYMTDQSLQGDCGVHLQVIDLLVQFHEKQISDEVSILHSTEDIKVKGKNI